VEDKDSDLGGRWPTIGGCRIGGEERRVGWGLGFECYLYAKFVGYFGLAEMWAGIRTFNWAAMVGRLKFNGHPKISRI
jgi:hypothetical protein